MSDQNPRLGFATRAIHLSDWPTTVPSHPIAAPIYQTASFGFDKNEDIADALKEESYGHVYSRLSNPTVGALERGLASLEGGEDALGLASGMAAIHAAAISLAGAGDHVVAPISMYGGTFGLFARVLPRLGIKTTFVKNGDLAEYAKAMKERTRIVYAETISNPTLDVAPLPGLAEIAHAKGAKLIVDSTFASPYLCRPLENGADLVIHSATKYLGGHGDLIAGMIVGNNELVHEARRVTDDVGGTMAPFVAWLIQRGLKTLSVRMARHCSNAATLAERLAGHPRVKRVSYPGLTSHKDHALARQLLPTGFGGMLAFDVDGDRAAGARVMDRLRIIARAPSLGDTHSLAIQPAATSHRQLDDQELAAAGISPGFIRLSVGLEDADDLWSDLTQALAL